MTYTRKQVVTCLSVLYLLAAVALAGYASSRANSRHVPISDALKGFATVLPIISGILLECGYDLTRRQERRQHLTRGEIKRPPLVILVKTIIFIYSTAVITLLGTHAAPSAELDCGLRSRWQTLFRQKDAGAIRAIQDAFQCCGLTNPQDMAWPFPDKSHDQHACEKAFGRTSGCFGAWKGEEQQIAGMLIGVVCMVFMWQLAIIFIPTQRDSWLHRIAPDRISRMIADECHGGSNGAQDATRYISEYPYSDRIEEENDPEDSIVPERAIEEGNRRLNSLLPGGREQDQEPAVENAWAR